MPKDLTISLLKSLIHTPSFSKEENQTVHLIGEHLSMLEIEWHQQMHNIWAKNQHFDEGKPTLLLNSHHDTVKPNTGYTRDPFSPDVEEGKLYGLGSNDAGGALVSLIHLFQHFYHRDDLNFNLVLACTAEEEISGKNGIALLLPSLPSIDMAIVGEPTSMQMAVAEKGLMVLDCEAKGESGHAARNEGVNAIYQAFEDINWFKTYQFERESEYLGPIKMTTTLIESGTQHNVVPDSCKYVVDVRTTDAYTNAATLDIIREHVGSTVEARSTRLNPSGIDQAHPLVEAAKFLGIETFGSPTLSDQALLDLPSVKLGPGDSRRSHTADEYIYLDQIDKGIDTYIELLEKLNKLL